MRSVAMMAGVGDVKWWKSGVIYQIYPRSWADGNGDGVGDFDGITSRLVYLVDTLPVDAVWISPFYPSPQADFGYDVSDYCDVDPQYGDLDSFDRFLEEAHRLGLRVIVDWVPNHSSDRHLWFEESRSSQGSPKRDWYVWRDGRAGDMPPNNWRSMFGGPAWTFDANSEQWYLHSFLAQQPDLNWRNPEVESAMLETLRFWLRRGVDGFRIDVAQRCMKDPLLRDNPIAAALPEDAYKLNLDYAAQHHLYDVAHPDIHLTFRRIRQVIDEFETDDQPRFSVGEIHEYDWRVWASYYGWDLSELHMPFNFGLLPAGVDPERIQRTALALEAALPSGAWPNWVMGNHDEPRIATRHGSDQSRAKAVLLLTLRGTPTMYYGDELGMVDAVIAPERQQDPWGRQMPGYGRDGCRTPMLWDRSSMAGFTQGATSWLPITDQDWQSVEAQRGDDNSHLELYCRLLRVRRDEPALAVGDIDWVSSPGDPNPIVYRRTYHDRSLVVAINMSESTCSLDVEGLRDPEPTGNQVLVATHRDRQGGPAPVELRPWEAVVLG